ncbi:MAG: hypothetical protein ACLR17_06005 [Enterobacteriaceae bacterium]
MGLAARQAIGHLTFIPGRAIGLSISLSRHKTGARRSQPSSALSAEPDAERALRLLAMAIVTSLLLIRLRHLPKSS